MERMAALQFRIHGMDCAEEVAILRRELGPLVRDANRLSFDVLNGRLTVLPGDADAPFISADTVVQVVGRTGMRAEIWHDDQPRSNDLGSWQPYGRTTLTAVSGLLIVAAVIAHAVHSGSAGAALGVSSSHEHVASPLPVKVLFGMSVLAGIWGVLPKAWLSVRRGRPDMNLLMTIAIVGAACIDEWFEAATVAFLFALSLALEAWSVGRARRAVAALMELSPPVARLSESGTRVPAETVAIGTRIMVQPGERIPLDGQVVTGQSHVNEAPITGESLPVAKQPGSEVFAGTINGDGALVIQTTRTADDTTLANIIRLVRDAQSRRAPAEMWVERFAQIYTPVVMVAALGCLVIPPLVFSADWTQWLYNALVLLVIACPCALVISTPVTIVAALASAARRGVLVKGGQFIELPATLAAIAFDKTGTLTMGKAVVREVVPLAGHSVEELLIRASAMEQRSDHPLAQAIVQFAAQRNIQPSPADDFQITPGKGASARFDGRPFWLGSHRYLEERGQETPEVHALLERLSASGHTVVVVGNDNHVCGLIALADDVRPECRQVLTELRGQGIQHLVMLTGDNRPTAQMIAESIGMEEYRAELLPVDKVASIEELVARFGNVAMVGDGVNDAPALARATIGIAMGAAGSDAALETADIALMSDDLRQVSWLVSHSRRALAVIRQNIAFSLGVKALFVALTFAGWSSLWAAIAADTGASLLVVANGLRLLGRKD